jgi:hypothetical protein
MIGGNMRKRLGILLAAGVALMSASVLPAAAAASAPVPSPATPLTNLTFTEVGTSWAGPVNKQVTLQCEPTGGTHPTAEDACTKLIAVDGRFALLPRAQGYGCGAVWMPVTVTVTGTWRLQPVYFTKTYGNDCEAAVGSNFVFRF